MGVNLVGNWLWSRMSESREYLCDQKYLVITVICVTIKVYIKLSH